ncbi:MAG: hypothetical protein KTR33_15510 [Gammaproteobacteria bacterium]|nr:hypothetical protein [Gammaproteobacteria bacterium]
MTDLQKRETLKRMGITGISALAASLAASPAASTPVLTALNASSVEDLNPRAVMNASRGVSDLSINIIATTSVPESTAVFTNMTDEELLVQHFLPGTIVFGNRSVDLNGVPASPLLRIAPHGVVSRPVQLVPVDTGAIMEYVWADDAVSPISEHTDVITLGAFVADRRLLVYPVPTLPVPA